MGRSSSKMVTYKHRPKGWEVAQKTCLPAFTAGFPNSDHISSEPGRQRLKSPCSWLWHSLLDFLCSLLTSSLWTAPPDPELPPSPQQMEQPFWRGVLGLGTPGTDNRGLMPTSPSRSTMLCHEDSTETSPPCLFSAQGAKNEQR